MGRKYGMVLWALAVIWWVSGAAWSWPVPDTGQTICYDDVGGVIDPCPGPGDPFHGQDGCYLINPPSYTRLDANGNALPPAATSWVMVLDNVTGLVWEVKRNKDRVKDYNDPHDADNTYTWYDSNPATNGGDAGTPGDGTDAEDFLAALNAESFGGFTDWRLPTVYELRSISDLGRYNPPSDPAFFPNTALSLYWSSTTSVYDTGYALILDFIYGWDKPWAKSGSCGVRAVRGGHGGSADSLIDNGDGTVTDAGTGLMWQQATARDDEGILLTMTWEEALAYCEDLDLAGHDDWRLPNQKELASIVDYTRLSPAIDTASFPDTAASDYWSSTTRAGLATYAWGAYFYLGLDGQWDKSSSLRVRAVRGGPSRSHEYLGLVSSYYGTVLGRAAEPGGAQSWCNEIDRIVNLGIDVKEGFIALGMTFFNSQEYMDSARSNAECVGDLYETFLQRTPSLEEINEWVAQLDQGLRRGVLLTYFACCEEFKMYMEGVFGTTATRPENNLVNDFYRGLLHRLPDTGGFEYWRGVMRTAQCTDAQAIKDAAYAEADAFFQCGEYDETGKSNAQFVEDLFNAFMRRGADLEGFNYWVNELGTGALSRAELLTAFVDSTEFQGRVNDVIAAGCLE